MRCRRFSRKRGERLSVTESCFDLSGLCVVTLLGVSLPLPPSYPCLLGGAPPATLLSTSNNCKECSRRLPRSSHTLTHRLPTYISPACLFPATPGREKPAELDASSEDPPGLRHRSARLARSLGSAGPLHRADPRITGVFEGVDDGRSRARIGGG